MELLVPVLEEGAKTSPDGYSRVVTTSSSTSYLDMIDYETMKDTPKRFKTGHWNLYAKSKLV